MPDPNCQCEYVDVGVGPLMKVAEMPDCPVCCSDLSTMSVLYEVSGERRRQDAKWGQQNHPDMWPEYADYYRAEYSVKADFWKQTNTERVLQANAAGTPSDRNAAWDGVLLEEVYEALAEEDAAKIRAELVQVAAVAVNWIEAIDRREV
jgi:hypothetical protein